jgi:hypothetical protein
LEGTDVDARDDADSISDLGAVDGGGVALSLPLHKIAARQPAGGAWPERAASTSDVSDRSSSPGVVPASSCSPSAARTCPIPGTPIPPSRASLREGQYADESARVDRFDVRLAQCTDPVETDLLLAVIESGYGSLDTFSASLRAVLRDAIATAAELTKLTSAAAAHGAWSSRFSSRDGSVAPLGPPTPSSRAGHDGFARAVY